MVPGDIVSTTFRDMATGLTTVVTGRVVCLASLLSERKPTHVVLDTGIPLPGESLPRRCQTLMRAMDGFNEHYRVVRGQIPVTGHTVLLLESIEKPHGTIDGRGAALLAELGLCTRCGSRGLWFTMCCSCLDHGRFLG